MSLLKFIKPGV